MKATDLLPSPSDVDSALGPSVHIEGAETGPAAPSSEVLRAAALQSAFRRFSGTLTLDEAMLPVAVSIMALVFSSPEQAERTFVQVAEAAHLKADVDGCAVAVETATGPTGLVSYWGFVHRREAVVVITLDSLDPQHLSVADLRSLVRIVAQRLEAAPA